VTREELTIEDGKFPMERYAPMDILGSGVSGTVYLSRDRKLRRDVAVKVLRVLDNEALIGFQNEARTTSKLSHPHIVKVLDFGITDNGVPFMVMDLVPGDSLEKLIADQGGIEPLSVCAIFKTIAEALGYAHSTGVLHRDLKPSNIIVSQTENQLDAFLIDFGVAKMQERLKTTIVNGTALVGTPSYMSPDQALGHSFDKRSDIYSLGCIMFEALTGSPPFKADSPLELVGLQATKAPPSLLEYFEESGTISALDRVVQTCLMKDPRERYQDCTAFKRALQAVPQPGSEHEVQQSAARAHGASPRRIRLSLVLTAGLLLLTGIVALFSSQVFQKTEVFPTNSVRLESPIRVNGSPEFFCSRRGSDVKISGYNGATDDALKRVLAKNPGVTQVDLTSSAVTGKGMKILTEYPSITSITFNQLLKPSQLRALARVSSLNYLSISGEEKALGSSALKNLLEFLHLKSLRINSANLNLEDLQAIAGQESLEFLSLPNCTGLSSSDLSVLNRMRNLERLDLRGSDVDDESVEQLTGCKLISQFNLANTIVTDKSIPNFLKLKTLKTIWLDGTNLSDQGYARLESQKQLQVHRIGDARDRETLQNVYGDKPVPLMPYLK